MKPRFCTSWGWSCAPESKSRLSARVLARRRDPERAERVEREREVKARQQRGTTPNLLTVVLPSAGGASPLQSKAPYPANQSPACHHERSEGSAFLSTTNYPPTRHSERGREIKARSSRGIRGCFYSKLETRYSRCPRWGDGIRHSRVTSPPFRDATLLQLPMMVSS